MLVVTENMTVDGVIDATEGWFSPAGAEGDVGTSGIEATLREHMRAQDALLLGRLTFESFREYWPKQTDDATGVTAHLNAVQKYVMSFHSKIRSGRTPSSSTGISSRRFARSSSSRARRSASPAASASCGS
jgi:dihydrofolate reductase